MGVTNTSNATGIPNEDVPHNVNYLTHARLIAYDHKQSNDVMAHGMNVPRYATEDRTSLSKKAGNNAQRQAVSCLCKAWELGPIWGHTCITGKTKKITPIP